MGYSLSAWLNFGMYFVSENGTSSSFPWRFPIAFQMIPALLLLAGSPWLPYSPRWLIMQDRIDEALAVIKRLHRTKEDANDTLAASEFRQMKSQVELHRRAPASSSSTSGSSSAFQLLKTPSNRKRAIIAFFVMFNNQFTGILVLNNYLVLLLSTLGLSGYRPLLLSAVYVLATFPGNIFCGLYVERFGRRTFTLIGLTGVVVVLSVEAALQAQFLGTSNRAAQNAAIVFLFLVASKFSHTGEPDPPSLPKADESQKANYRAPSPKPPSGPSSLTRRNSSTCRRSSRRTSAARGSQSGWRGTTWPILSCCARGRRRLIIFSGGSSSCSSATRPVVRCSFGGTVRRPRGGVWYVIILLLMIVLLVWAVGAAG